jgi:serine/threonine-protein kinase
MARGEALPEDEAIHALRSMTGTSQEKEAIEALRKAARVAPLGEPLRLALAGLLQQRGEPAEALATLGSPATVGGLIFQADLRASQGDLAGACASLERVLARDIAAPGARERLERWRARLGLPSLSGEAPLQDGTLFTSATPTTPFRIVAEAGRGGAAVVYQAEDEGLGRPLALKVYHRPRDAREQIEREASLAAEAAGVGVVRIFDADLDQGWLALEWAPGGTLRDHLRCDPAFLLPVDCWLPSLLAAVARLHRLGWAHGDLKPGNVLFASSGRPLLTDFGVARRPGEPWQGGTVGYLSPRRLSGAPASLADDVYALGRLLEDVASALGERTPPPLRALAERCLADDRPPSAEALLAFVPGSAETPGAQPKKIPRP